VPVRCEEKIRIVLEGLQSEDSISVLCRREKIATSLYYSWSKEFLEAGKRRPAGDTACQATSPEAKGLRAEAAVLKEAVADLTLEDRLLKGSMLQGEPWSAIGPRPMAEGQDRAMAPDPQEPHPARELLPARGA
jgi:transposase